MKITKKTAFQDRGVWVTGRDEFDEGRDLTFTAKVFDEPSEYGIGGHGRISKLDIRLGDEIIARYDRGAWDIEAPEEAMPLLDAIKSEFN